MLYFSNHEQLLDYLEEVFPQIREQYDIESLGNDHLTMRMFIDEQHLRPGGTVSGPSMFALVDCAVYAMVLARVGREALTVTTNCSIDFMRKPAAGKDLITDIRLLKLGKALAVCDAMVYSEGSDEPVARASMTYSIPPKRH